MNSEEAFRYLQGVPKNWAHKHYSDETEEDFDEEFVGTCSVCTERLETAIENGWRCVKHPFSACVPPTRHRPMICDECEQEKNETKT